MSFYLSFDYGLNHIGVALGNDITMSVRPLKAVKVKQGKVTPETMRALIKEWQPKLLVVGLPLMLDGTEQPLTKKARHFANQLREWYKLEVVLVDERLTTKSAKEQIFEQGGFRALASDKGAIDCAAAALILESYFDSALSSPA